MAHRYGPFDVDAGIIVAAILMCADFVERPPPQNHPRILVVDDHGMVRAGLISLLQTRWDVCGEASNGIEAIEKVGELKPDVILLDLSMPLMSGTRAAQFIRSVAPHIKIVFLSMYDGPTSRDLVRITGADAFVSKKSDAAELLEVIGNCLQGPAQPAF
jgi:DNA-binding NarL/FixJ family response regulator